MSISFRMKITKTGTPLKELETKIKPCISRGLKSGGDQLAKAITAKIHSGGAIGPAKVRDDGQPLLMHSGKLASSFKAVMEGEMKVSVGSVYPGDGALRMPLIDFHEDIGVRRKHGGRARRKVIEPTLASDWNKFELAFETAMNACLGR